MIMSMHDPLSRKRPLSETGVGEEVENQGSIIKKARDDEFNDKMYSLYVKTALEKLDVNETNQIESLSTKIELPIGHDEAISLSNFKVVLKTLISNISKLDHDACNSLIILILKYKWIKVDDESFKDIYCQFLTVLVSSIPNYLFKVLIKIAQEFKDLNPTNSLLHHKILKHIVKYNPTILNKFPSIFQSSFPHHLASDSQSLNNYICNLLETLNYCEELQYDIWLLITECCIKLDVELQNDLDDLDDEEIDDLINGDEEDEEKKDVADSDSDSEDENDADDDEIDSDNDSEEEGANEEYLLNPMTSTKDIKTLVNKLDCIMEILLKSTAEYFTAEKLSTGKGIYLFNTLSSLFKSHILPTHFTKLIQFILFHVSQQQIELSDSFLVLLIDIAFNPHQILETRLKSMQYLSSYIARAKNLSKNQIVFVVSYLMGWLNKYIEEREFEINLSSSANKNVGGMERFKLFYSTFQGLLYIFCFRYKLLQIDNKGDFEWESEIDKFFQRVIITKFNPLKFIDETVCFIFANIATKLNVCYCYSIIEHNKRERMLNSNVGDKNKNLPAPTGNFKQKQEFLDLQGYFPFDPLVLPLSKSLISEVYIEWSDVNPNQDEDEDDETTSPGNQLTSSDDDNDLTSSEDDDSDDE